MIKPYQHNISAITIAIVYILLMPTLVHAANDSIHMLKNNTTTLTFSNTTKMIESIDDDTVPGSVDDDTALATINSDTTYRAKPPSVQWVLTRAKRNKPIRYETPLLITDIFNDTANINIKLVNNDTLILNRDQFFSTYNKLFAHTDDTNIQLQLIELYSHIIKKTPLKCVDKKTKKIVHSNITKGCKKNQMSLGAYPIVRGKMIPKKLNDKLYARFIAAQAKAKTHGVYLYISSGLRSYERQEVLFQNAMQRYDSRMEASKWVLPADVSNHVQGLAIDVNYTSGGQRAAGWLEKNGYRFGLCRVYENEWWHFEPIIAPGEPCPPLLKDASVTYRRYQATHS